jgi:hypothetical protein
VALDVNGSVNATSHLIGGRNMIGFGIELQVVFNYGSSTWTVPAGVYGVKIITTGGGGGGGGCGQNSNSSGGGSAGGTSIWTGPISSGTVFTISVGGGGTGGAVGLNNGNNGAESHVKVGSTYYTYANPGIGGYSPKNECVPGSSSPYTPSVSSLAQLYIPGGHSHTHSPGNGGSNGGASYWGGGGMGGNAQNSTNDGYSGAAPGSGGGGARYQSAGGNGANGIVVISYFQIS